MSGFDTSPDPALAIINDIMKQLQENSASMRMLWEVNHNRLSKRENMPTCDNSSLTRLDSFQRGALLRG